MKVKHVMTPNARALWITHSLADAVAQAATADWSLVN